DNPMQLGVRYGATCRYARPVARDTRVVSRSILAGGSPRVRATTRRPEPGDRIVAHRAASGTAGRQWRPLDPSPTAAARRCDDKGDQDTEIASIVAHRA